MSLMRDLGGQPRSRLVISGLVLIAIAYLLAYPLKQQYRPRIPSGTYSYPSHPSAHNQTRPKRVAIIGAGASGSAAAFFLSRAARVAENRADLPEGSLLSEIVVYERERYVGGRMSKVGYH